MGGSGAWRNILPRSSHFAGTMCHCQPWAVCLYICTLLRRGQNNCTGNIGSPEVRSSGAITAFYAVLGPRSMFLAADSLLRRGNVVYSNIYAGPVRQATEKLSCVPIAHAWTRVCWRNELANTSRDATSHFRFPRALHGVFPADVIAGC